MESLIPIFFVLGLIIINAIFKKRGQEEGKEDWQLFAANNQLEFLAGDFPNGSYVVTGTYRGYTFKLDSRRRGKEKERYTRIKITRVTEADASVRAQIQTNQIAKDNDVPTMYLEPTDPYPFKGTVTVQAASREFVYEHFGLVTSPERLQKIFDFMSDLAHDYSIWVALGGEAVPTLHKAALDKKSVLYPVAERILDDIMFDTRRRLGHNMERHFCVYCLTHCGMHSRKLEWWKVNFFYHGCRLCQQSRNIFTGQIVAVLDNETDVEQHRENDVLLANWVVRRQLFDFSAVRIEQATDEEVERFIVQIGNDTDPERQGRYAHMECQVSADCRLSENSQKLLQRTFGQVTFAQQPVRLDDDVQAET